MNTDHPKAQTLKRFQDAISGRKLSGTASHNINSALSGDGPYSRFCDGDEKLPGIHRAALQAIVDRMIADGVVASTSLLTPRQAAALKKYKAEAR